LGDQVAAAVDPGDARQAGGGAGARRRQPRGVPEIPRAAFAAAARLPEDVVIAQPLRHAYFGPARGWRDTAIINRSDLREPRAGPCIIEEYDSTCVVPPGSTANLDPFGNIVIDVCATPP
jgi:N-methylhydantoinase A